MQVSVFIKSIVTVQSGVVVRASNGGLDGPPLLVINVAEHEAKALRLGQRVHIDVRFD